MESAESSTSAKNQELPFRFRVLLEPKGFIRTIEFFLAVLMFATTAGYSSYYQYKITCNNGTYPLPTFTYKFAYPFNFEPVKQACEASNVTNFAIQASPGGKAAFFVAIGVLAMLYCIATLIWYVIFEVKFYKFDLVPVADLVVTIIFAVFFFLASCVWASGVNTVKYWTTFDNIKEEFYKKDCTDPANTCKSTRAAKYGSLNISIVFGFLNIIVWAGNCWFLYKETVWFRRRQEKNQSGAAEEAPRGDM